MKSPVPDILRRLSKSLSDLERSELERDQSYQALAAKNISSDKTSAVETCCVVDQFCESPANLEEPVPVKTHCYACGEPVCKKCSSIRTYLQYGKQRLCNNCQVELDGNDDRIMARLKRMAGYK